MRRLSRSILVLSVVVALNAPTVHARVVNDDGDPRGPRIVPRIVRVVKQIIKLISQPLDDGNGLSPPHP